MNFLYESGVTLECMTLVQKAAQIKEAKPWRGMSAFSTEDCKSEASESR